MPEGHPWLKPVRKGGGNAPLLGEFFRVARDTLRNLAPENPDNLNVVLLTPGPHNETYFEHAYLARYLGEIKLTSRQEAPVVLEVKDLTLAPAYRAVSFAARGGEVLGIYGFMGCGQLELARTLFGGLVRVAISTLFAKNSTIVPKISEVDSFNPPDSPE